MTAVTAPMRKESSATMATAPDVNLTPRFPDGVISNMPQAVILMPSLRTFTAQRACRYIAFDSHFDLNQSIQHLRGGGDEVSVGCHLDRISIYTAKRHGTHRIPYIVLDY